MAADPSRMMTSWSLNCSRTSSQRGVGGSSGRAGMYVSERVLQTRHNHNYSTISPILLDRFPDLLIGKTLVFIEIEMF